MLLASRPCRERDLVMAMIVQRLTAPCSKLATVRQWGATTLSEQLQVQDADENELYAALDWLLKRQSRIEGKLAKRHLCEGTRIWYDVSSSSYHGRHCPLAARGHNRDKEGLACIVWGMLADVQGRPIAVEVYPGNTGDPATVADQVEKLRGQFGLERVVMVGDRGMLTQARIKELKQHPQLGWISALRSESIRALVNQGAIQLSLFDEQNLAEVTSDLYPGERLMVCFNPLLAEDRKRTREELLVATEKELEKIAAEVKRRTNTPLEAAEIGLKVGRRINHFNVAKHFLPDIQDGYFAYTRNTQRIEQEAQLDGIYVIRTSEPKQTLSAQDAVRVYKNLAQVELAFRCIKSLDIRIRPIHHRTEDHVRAHVLLCMLAYYVEWHIRKALSTVLFEDEDLDQARWTRDPVAKAHPSESVQRKKQTRKTVEGWPVHSFQSLMKEMATRCKNRCRVGQGKNAASFTTVTEPTGFQKHVLELIERWKDSDATVVECAQ
jgi:transposase